MHTLKPLKANAAQPTFQDQLTFWTDTSQTRGRTT